MKTLSLLAIAFAIGHVIRCIWDVMGDAELPND